MPCFHPMEAWRSKRINKKTGKRSITFTKSEAYVDLPVTLPCGRCIGCRLEHSRQWAIRCVHEASLYEDNCFITLTYAPQHLPENGTLVKKDFQDFMKRLRKRFGSGVRYFHAGEYGEEKRRPHYHALLFNFDFPDKRHVKTHRGHKYYESEALDEIWGKGMCVIGDLTFESAAYVARYVTKKMSGDYALAEYTKFSPFTGEIFYELQPEYATMSRRPGIGKPWLEKFSSDVYPDDFVVINGKQMRPPKYYDKAFELDHKAAFAMIRARRKFRAQTLAKHTSFERLRVREEIQLRKFDLLHRGYENDL